MTTTSEARGAGRAPERRPAIPARDVRGLYGERDLTARLDDIMAHMERTWRWYYKDPYKP